MAYYLNLQFISRTRFMYHRSPTLALTWVHDAVKSYFSCLKGRFGNNCAGVVPW